MKRKLIVVADDFGFSEAYNYGAVKAYRDGIVTALSLMSNMEAAPHGVALAKKEAPDANLTLHINFVQGRPVSRPEDVSSLVDENGMFYRSYQWKEGGFGGKKKCVGDVVVKAEDCARETEAQLERFKELTGSYPNHFEGHSVITDAVKWGFHEAAVKYGIHCMTEPEVETAKMYAVHEILFDNPSAMEALHRGFSPEDFYEDRLGLLDSPFEYQVMHLHPGYLDGYLLRHTSLTTPRCQDLETVCDSGVRKWLEEHEIELVDFSAIYK